MDSNTFIHNWIEWIIMDWFSFTIQGICTIHIRDVKIKINNGWHFNKPSLYGTQAMKLIKIHTTLVPGVLWVLVLVRSQIVDLYAAQIVEQKQLGLLLVLQPPVQNTTKRKKFTEHTSACVTESQNTLPPSLKQNNINISKQNQWTKN